MSTNIMKQYITITENFIKNFAKIFLEKEYNSSALNTYIDTYIFARIYNFGDDNPKKFYKKIYSSLLNTKEQIEKDGTNIDEKVLINNAEIFEFIFYIDGVRPITDLTEFISDLCEKRTNKYKIDTNKEFEIAIKKLIKQFDEEKDAFFKKYDSKSFELNIEKYKLVDNTYNVTLNYNFKIPYIYSQQIIDEVYNEGTINEDKYKIEYLLLVLQCIKDINRGKFNTVYLVDFPSSLYNKEKKRKQYLQILDNQLMHDKVILKIQYDVYQKNKKIINSIMREGCKFAIIIDDKFTFNAENMAKLEMFEYILVSEKNKNYKKIKQKERTIKSKIIYDY